MEKSKFKVMILALSFAVLFLAQVYSTPAAYSKGKDAALVDRQISWVWQQCEKEGIRDYDGNGTVNCCDRATAFCIKWRQSYSRRIRLCQQKRMLDHMYVQIWLDGYGWWSIDPRWTSNGTHDMKEVWKWKYDARYDDTDAYWVVYFTKLSWQYAPRAGSGWSQSYR